MNSNYDSNAEKREFDHIELMQKQRERKTETVVFAGGQSYEIAVKEQDSEK